MRSRPILRSAVGLLIVAAALGCSNSPSQNAAACECRIEGDGADTTLVMSWSCYCTDYGDCDRQLAGHCASSTQLTRYDYPECHLSGVTLPPLGVSTVDYFDWQGRLAGVEYASDTSPYRCPSDPRIEARKMRAGQTPVPTCGITVCGSCNPGPIPCGLDAGAGQ
jgi:hypothetical protein